MTRLNELVQVPFESRELDWEQSFIKELLSSSLHIVDSEPLNGPDGWPYLHARIQNESSEPCARILNWLSQKGIGLLIDHGDNQEYPDYVLSWGMVWYLNRFQKLEFNLPSLSDKNVEIDWNEVNRWGEPNEDYLPTSVKKMLREFFNQQEVLTPRYLVFTLDGKNFDIAFSIESLGNPPENEHQGLLEAISWFLPPHYSLMLLSEKNSPPFLLL